VSYRSTLSRLLDAVIAPSAERVRAQGRFPRSSLTALGQAGLLGLTVSTDLGGGGRGLADAADVVTRVAGACPATAAVLQSHYAAAAVVEAYGSRWLRGEIAAGHHLSSLALDEPAAEGRRTRLQPGAPDASATRSGGVVALRARKHDVVAAGEADSYIWSSRPLAARDGLTLWVVPAHAADLFVPARPDGAGPYGSGTSTVFADPVLIPADAMLGPDGEGFDIVQGIVEPWLLELQTAVGAAVTGPVAVGGSFGPARLATDSLA
jgi:alkylation response protein AidB-like acyl-CoA dehydrogenase